MISNPRLKSYTAVIIISVLISLLVLTNLPVSAEYTGDGVIGRYDDWELENSPTVGMGIFPSVELPPEKNTETSSTAKITTSSGTGIWVTISPFFITLNGQETNMLIGYLSGDRMGATLTVAGKGASDTDFSDITTIEPDENGLFAWAVPASRSNMDLFRVVARSAGTQVLSNAIRFTNDTEEPVVKPVVSPVRTAIPMVTGGSSASGLSTLTISTRSTTPKVGESVVITGRLTDQDGKGISGATVSIDETGYPGAAQAEPFDTTVTGSDGRFSFTLNVSFANMVGLVANYEGDESHSSAESNTITFTTSE